MNSLEILRISKDFVKLLNLQYYSSTTLLFLQQLAVWD